MVTKLETIGATLSANTNQSKGLVDLGTTIVVPGAIIVLFLEILHISLLLSLDCPSGRTI